MNQLPYRAGAMSFCTEQRSETTRLSIEKCRELLGRDAQLMSDPQVEAVRDAIYTVVDSVLDIYFDVSSVCPDHE
jgi:hypothetical protein